jgi:hypothetical protein
MGYIGTALGQDISYSKDSRDPVTHSGEKYYTALSLNLVYP